MESERQNIISAGVELQMRAGSKAGGCKIGDGEIRHRIPFSFVL